MKNQDNNTILANLDFINILFLMYKCIVYEAQMAYLRMPSLPLMKDMKDRIVTFIKRKIFRLGVNNFLLGKFAFCSFISFIKKTNYPLQIRIIGRISVSLHENLIPNWGNDDK